jgi:anionic cell wall polymer biosynthesis LytR-Cps2A-Psr (LCP) family protein
MATVVAITDERSFESNTDILVVADPVTRTLLWVPRDLWCEGLRDRINQAYRLQGHDGVIRALAEHGIEARHGVYVSRAAAAAALDGVVVEVSVPERLEFWYPLSPERPIEEGRKRIAFDPPHEELSGERIHQWIGARYGADRERSDLDRIERQKVLLEALLRDGYDFNRALAPGLPVEVSAPEALEELARVRPTWRFATLADLEPATMDGMKVLTRGRSRDPE